MEELPVVRMPLRSLPVAVGFAFDGRDASAGAVFELPPDGRDRQIPRR
jgi:hypothetical protein